MHSSHPYPGYRVEGAEPAAPGGNLLSQLVGELAGSAVDWGSVSSMQQLDQNLSGGESLYQIQASRDGILTVEAFFAHASGDVNMELRDAGNNVVASSNSSSDNERLDYVAGAGDAFVYEDRVGDVALRVGVARVEA